jgi:fibronectin-binding autotransporter adhesin
MQSTMMVQGRRSLAPLFLAVVGVSVAASSAYGQANIYSWTGAGGNANWNTAGNWNNGVPASSITTTLTFTNAGAAGATLNNDITGLTLSTILFHRSLMTTTTNYTINGNSITIASGGSITFTGGGVTAGNMTVTINTPLVAAGALTIANSGTNSNILVIGGSLTTTAASGNQVITLTGASTGAATILGAITDGGSATVGILKDAAGSWTLTGANIFTGGLQVNAGTLTLSGLGQSIGGGITLSGGSLNIGTSINLSSGGITIYTGTLTASNANALGTPGTLATIVTGSGAVTPTIVFGALGSATTLNRTINMTGTSAGLVIANNSATATGTLILQGSFEAITGTSDLKRITLTGANTGISEVQSVIGTAASSSNFSILKAGAGGWFLNAANVYTGTVSVQNGTLYYSSVSNDGSTASSLGIGNAISLGATTVSGVISYSGTSLATISRVIRLDGTTGGGGISNTSASITNSLLVNGNLVSAASG